ncbi:hypothetical protein HZS_3208 [Henneguya salminicola]|nr:hypothetical protein HZS_3208 [Henneguya salminicola]
MRFIEDGQWYIFFESRIVKLLCPVEIKDKEGKNLELNLPFYVKYTDSTLKQQEKTKENKNSSKKSTEDEKEAEQMRKKEEKARDIAEKIRIKEEIAAQKKVEKEKKETEKTVEKLKKLDGKKAKSQNIKYQTLD